MPTMCLWKCYLLLLFGFYREGLTEANERDAAFASSLESFGGGPDPISMAFGGKIKKFQLNKVVALGWILLHWLKKLCNTICFYVPRSWHDKVCSCFKRNWDI